MYWDIEVTPDDEDEMIEKIARRVHDSGMNVAAILMMETFKPMSYIGAQMGRFFVSPFLPVLGDDVGINGEKILQIFEKQENIEKLVKAVEALEEEEAERKKAEKAEKLERKKAESDNGETQEKGWRRFLPF